MGKKPTRSNKVDSITNRSSKEATVENKTRDFVSRILHLDFLSKLVIGTEPSKSDRSDYISSVRTLLNNRDIANRPAPKASVAKAKPVAKDKMPKTIKIVPGINLWVTNKAGLSGLYVMEKLGTRKLLKLLRNENFLPDSSKGKVSIEVLEDNALILVSSGDNEIVVEVFESEFSEEYQVASPYAPVQNNNGLTTNFGIVTTRAIFATDYSWVGDDEENDFGEQEFSVDRAEYLEKQEKRQAKIERNDLIKAKRVLAEQAIEANQNISISKLNPEIIRLMASQIIDAESSPKAYGNLGGDDKITVSVQRLSNKGMWFNLMHEEINPVTKKPEKVKSTLEFDLDMIFNLDDYGQPFSLKRKSGKDVLSEMMRQSGFPLVHSYSYYDEKSGELVFKAQQQRYILTGVPLRAGVTIEGKRLESTPSPTFASIVQPKKFFYKKIKGIKQLVKCIVVVTDGVTEYVPFTKHTMEVTSKNPAFFNYDNMVSLRMDNNSGADVIIVIPSTEDESHGDAGNKEFDRGIQTGTSVATPAMMSDEMTDDVISMNESEEDYLDYITMKERRYAKFAKDSFEYIATTDLGKRVLHLIPLTHQALDDAFLQMDIFEEIKTWTNDANDILKFLTYIRETEGTGFAYPSWKALSSLTKDMEKVKAKAEEDKRNKEFADSVDESIIANIANINAGYLKVEGLSDESIVAIREASLKYGKHNKACWIDNKDVSNKLKELYPLALAKTTGTKVSANKVQKFSAPVTLNEKELKKEQRKLKRAN